MSTNKVEDTKRPFTSEDVAAKAGVSQATVSRVFAGSANVSEKKRKKVMEVAQQLNYQPNAIARGLSTRKTQMIGIVVRDFRNPFYPAVLARFYNSLSAKGYHLIFINTEDEYIGEKEIGKLIDYNVDGVIITDALLSSSEAERFARHDIAVILFNRYSKQSPGGAVYCDNFQAGRQVATYLLGMGHRSFAFISGPANTSTTIDRKKGFEAVLKEKKLPAPVIYPGDYSFESGFKAAQEIVSAAKRVDCIFCANDIIAIGAMEGIRQMGCTIPEDISVVGFDDIDMAAWPSYALTTWSQPVDELVAQTVDLLIRQINGEMKEPQTVVLKGRLVVRDTVKRKK
jgi:DNA-binding LacI/PurR family transcriptional regulator